MIEPMARWWVAVAVFAGCYSPATERPCKVSCDVAAGPAAICPGDQECRGDGLCHAAGESGCPAPEVDAPLADVGLIDLPMAGPPYCFGSQGGLLRFCSNTLSTEVLTLPSSINTTNSGSCTATPMSGSTQVCVIYAGRIIANDVRAVGSRPLVLVAVQTITVQATVDAASRRTLGQGAGANTGLCPAPTDPTGGGGGAGGTFQGQGGNGGVAGSNSQGVAPPPVHPTTVRGGCSGGASLAIDGNPGIGGGVLYLIAGSAITVGSAGRLDVSGAGAFAGDGPGAGGGAGGLLVLDAAAFQIQGDLMANGGGGASGASGGVSASGGESAAPGAAAAGGPSPVNLFGGPGSAGLASLVGGAGGGMGVGFFAGGGGGGAGWIYYLGGTLSPTSRTSPLPVRLLP
jgi:hypothetical protein